MATEEQTATNIFGTHLQKVLPELYESAHSPGSTGVKRFETSPLRLGAALIRPGSQVLRDPALRNQLSQSFDREVFVRTTLFGKGAPAYTAFPNSTIDRARLPSPQTGDLVQRPGEKVRILVRRFEPVLKELAERFQVHLFGFGINAKIDVLSSDAFRVALLADKYDIVILGWTPKWNAADGVARETQVKTILSELLKPILGEQIPRPWQTVMSGGRPVDEEMLLKDAYLIPLVFFHNTYQVDGELVRFGIRREQTFLDLANLYLKPKTP